MDIYGPCPVSHSTSTYDSLFVVLHGHLYTLRTEFRGSYYLNMVVHHGLLYCLMLVFSYRPEKPSHNKLSLHVVVSLALSPKHQRHRSVWPFASADTPCSVPPISRFACQNSLACPFSFRGADFFEGSNNRPFSISLFSQDSPFCSHSSCTVSRYYPFCSGLVNPTPLYVRACLWRWCLHVAVTRSCVWPQSHTTTLGDHKFRRTISFHEVFIVCFGLFNVYP